VKSGVLFGTGAKVACFAMLLSSAALLGSPAEAAGPAVKAVKTDAGAEIAQPAAVKDADTTSSVQSPSTEPGCLRPRKRLWVEGEGWVVRRVTVCY
jgi:hypothetical protein